MHKKNGVGSLACILNSVKWNNIFWKPPLSQKTAKMLYYDRREAVGKKMYIIFGRIDAYSRWNKGVEEENVKFG